MGFLYDRCVLHVGDVRTNVADWSVPSFEDAPLNGVRCYVQDFIPHPYFLPVVVNKQISWFARRRYDLPLSLVRLGDCRRALEICA